MAAQIPNSTLTQGDPNLPPIDYKKNLTHTIPSIITLTALCLFVLSLLLYLLCRHYNIRLRYAFRHEDPAPHPTNFWHGQNRFSRVMRPVHRRAAPRSYTGRSSSTVVVDPIVDKHSRELRETPRIDCENPYAWPGTSDWSGPHQSQTPIPKEDPFGRHAEIIDGTSEAGSLRSSGRGSLRSSLRSSFRDIGRNLKSTAKPTEKPPAFGRNHSTTWSYGETDLEKGTLYPPGPTRSQTWTAPERTVSPLSRAGSVISRAEGAVSPMDREDSPRDRPLTQTRTQQMVNEQEREKQSKRASYNQGYAANPFVRMSEEGPFVEIDLGGNRR